MFDSITLEQKTLNLIKTIIESSHEHLDTCKPSFNKPLKNYAPLYFTIFSMKSICYTFVTKVIEIIFQKFSKDTLLSKISLPHSWPFKSDGPFNFQLFLISSHCNIFWTTGATEFVKNIFWDCFEDTTVTTNFLKSNICNTSCIEINKLYAIFNNKELGNFKAWMPVNWNCFQV